MREFDFVDVLRERQGSLFVGRGEYLSSFKRNLRLAPNDPEFRFIYNIYGQGGTGKTSILTQLEAEAREEGWLAGKTDEFDGDILLSLGRIVEGFGSPAHFADFRERFELYKARLDELRVDPNLPEGIAAIVGKAIGRGGVVFGRRIPFAGAAFDLVDEDVAGTAAAEWLSYLAKKLRSHEEVELLRDPVRQLTPLFLEGLRSLYATGRRVCILIDTFERTGEYFDAWLRHVLEGYFGRLAASFVFVIAGRDPLDENAWSPLRPVMTSWEIERFTDEEARQLLNRMGVRNGQVIEVILTISGGLPLLVATLGAQSPQEPEAIGDPSGTAVERFLRWTDDPARREIALRAAIPRRLDKDVLTVLELDASSAMEWLRTMPFVQQKARGWVYHDVVRRAMFRLTHAESLVRAQEVHRSLSQFYRNRRDASKRFSRDWREAEAERVYHWTASAGSSNAADVTALAVRLLQRAPDAGRAVADAIAAAGTDTQDQTLVRMGDTLARLARADEANFDEIASLTKKLSEDPSIADVPSARAEIALFRAQAAGDVGDHARALAEAESSVAADPSKPHAWIELARAQQRTRDFEAALSSIDRALSLYKENETERAILHVHRGLIYASQGDHDAALADYSAAIDIDGQLAWGHLSRGKSLRASGRTDEAVDAFRRALALDARFEHEAQKEIGETFAHQERFDEAIDAFREALSASPACGYCWLDLAEIYEKTGGLDAVTSQIRGFEIATSTNNTEVLMARGHALVQIGLVVDGVDELAEAIRLDPKNWYALVLRGRAYIEELDEIDEGIEDLNRAIDINNRSAPAFVERGVGFYRNAEFYAALRDLTRAITLDPAHYKAFGVRGQIRAELGLFQEAIEDFSRALAIVPSAARARLERARAYAHLEDFVAAVRDYEILGRYEADIAAEWGLILTYIDRLEEAEHVLERGLEDEASNVHLLYNLAVAVARRQGVAAGVNEIATARAALGQEDVARLEREYGIAGLAALEGHSDVAFERLEAACEADEIARQWAKRDRAWDELRADRRWRLLFDEGGEESKGVQK